MVHSTILKLRKQVEDLLKTNDTLLNNNASMAESNKNLRDEIKTLKQKLTVTESEKISCKHKCEVLVSEKDKIIREKEVYIAGLHNTVWNLKNSYLCSTYRFDETQEGFQLTFGFKSK